MNIILTIIFLIGLVVFIIHERIKYSRFKNELELSSIYRKMEEHFVVNKINLNKNFITLLKSYKNLSTNPEMLDIELLVISQTMLETRGVKKEEIKNESRRNTELVNSLGPEFKKLVSEFDQRSSSLIKLSILKPDFLWFVCKLYFAHFTHKGSDRFAKIKKELSFAKNNEMAISHQADLLTPC